MEKYDVIIIGAGVTGTAVARELSRYQIKTCVLEREDFQSKIKCKRKSADWRTG